MRLFYYSTISLMKPSTILNIMPRFTTFWNTSKTGSLFYKLFCNECIKINLYEPLVMKRAKTYNLNSQAFKDSPS